MLELVMAKIKDEIDVLAEHLTKGQMRTFDEYKYYTGRLEGLRAALQIVKETTGDEEELDLE